MNGKHSHRRCIAAATAALMLLALMTGCGEADEKKALSDTSTSQDAMDVFARKDVGVKLAHSLSDLIDQEMEMLKANEQLKEFDPTGKSTQWQLEVLERAKQKDGVSIYDYESAWSGYKQCMLDRGYKEIILIKRPNGLYVEASHMVGTAAQESAYAKDALECGAMHYSVIDSLYGKQIANPNLFKNPMEGAVDCLKRENVAKPEYTIEDLQHDLYGGMAEGTATLDLQSPAAASCLTGNGIRVGDNDEPIEQLW